jgi:hypothetical protein
VEHLRFALASWLALTLVGGSVNAAQESRLVVSQPRARRTIGDTVLIGDFDVPTLRAALEVLPRKPALIEVVDDRDLSAAVRKEVADLDAFVPVGTQTICLRRQSPTMREAEFTGGPYRLMLASVIWHEMAHAEGFNERDARHREEELWNDFIRSGRVESSVGLAYLHELGGRK